MEHYYANFKVMPITPIEVNPNRNAASGSVIDVGGELAELGISGMARSGRGESAAEAAGAVYETASEIVGNTTAEAACEAAATGVGSAIVETIADIVGGIFG